MQLPEYVTKLKEDEEFSFDCHCSVPCFTDCCRELELALSPYDLLRLRKATRLHSAELLERYIIIEDPPGATFPQFYLTMIDDGRASCVFVTPKGCSVYDHRPGACRTYPMGRGSVRLADGSFLSQYVLLKEKHCKGFEEKTRWTASLYTANQHLEDYNRYNDLVAEVLQHKRVKAGLTLSAQEREYFILALYDLDTFREKLIHNELPDPGELSAEQCSLLEKNDEKLLEFGVCWIKNILFQE